MYKETIFGSDGKDLKLCFEQKAANALRTVRVFAQQVAASEETQCSCANNCNDLTQAVVVAQKSVNV